MRAIVAVDAEWGIGAKNDLLFSLPLDMCRFRTITTGAVVLMGHNTLLSLPGAKGLRGRTNIVLAPVGTVAEDCTVVHTLGELAALAESFGDRPVYVIGGAMLYRTMLPYCHEVLVTKVDAVGGATVFFENLDENPSWELTATESSVVDNGHVTTYCTYTNRNPLPLGSIA